MNSMQFDQAKIEFIRRIVGRLDIILTVTPPLTEKMIDNIQEQIDCHEDKNNWYAYTPRQYGLIRKLIDRVFLLRETESFGVQELSGWVAQAERRIDGLLELEYIRTQAIRIRLRELMRLPDLADNSRAVEDLIRIIPNEKARLLQTLRELRTAAVNLSSQVRVAELIGLVCMRLTKEHIRALQGVLANSHDKRVHRTNRTVTYPNH